MVSISSSPVKRKYEAGLTNNDLLEGELKLESKIVADFPTTIEKSLLSQKIGKITESKMREVKQKIKELYGL